MASSLRSLSDTLSPAQSISQEPDFDDGDGFEVIGSHPSDSLCFEDNGGTLCTELNSAKVDSSVTEGVERSLQNGSVEQDTTQAQSLDSNLAFTLIHETHELKMSLMKHKDDLEQDRKAAKEAKDEAEAKIKDLEEQISNLNRDLLAANEGKQELAVQLNEFEKCKCERDEILAQNYAKEDEINYYKKMFSQLQAEGGFVNVNPPILTDAMMALELQGKDKLLQEEKKAREVVEKELAELKEREELLQTNNNELREMGGLYYQQMNEFRKDYEVLKNRYESKYGQDAGTSSSEASGEERHETFTCEKCSIIVADRNLYERHIQGCTGFVSQHI